MEMLSIAINIIVAFLCLSAIKPSLCAKLLCIFYEIFLREGSEIQLTQKYINSLGRGSYSGIRAGVPSNL
jgi:hypothetical protein